MTTLKKGASGPQVKGLQLRLNTVLKPSPKLGTDGIFGAKTEAALVRFQNDKRVVGEHGFVGPKTRMALKPPPAPPPPHMAKFVGGLGTIDDFVRHIVVLEVNRTPAAVLAALQDFDGTATGKRYLLVKQDAVGVVDFRHFFAAALQAYNSGTSVAALNVNLGVGGGKAMLLGVAVELQQCVHEALELKPNSCFSAEDLGSNRLGAMFGEGVRRKEKAGPLRVSDTLREYLSTRQPLPPEQVRKVTTPHAGILIMEAMLALILGVGDFVAPD